MNLLRNKTAVGFLAGFVFAIGLGVSRMTQPAKIQAFLDVAGDWDPSLIFVMGGAVVTSFLMFRWANRYPAPILAERFVQPTQSGIDGRLLGGAAVFGLGWGLSGFCPGPAITAVVSLHPGVLVFVAAMMAGMLAFHYGDAWLKRGAGQASASDPGAAEGSSCG